MSNGCRDEREERRDELHGGVEVRKECGLLDEREYEALLDAMERLKQVVDGMYFDGMGTKRKREEEKFAVSCTGPQAATA